MEMNWTSFRGALLAALLLPALAWAQVGDTVHLRSGTPIRGTITAISPDQVTVDSAAGSRNVLVADLQYIVFQDEPNDLGAARRNILQKNWNGAEQDIKKVATDATTREPIIQDVVYFKALAAAKMAMGEGGDKKAAEALMLSFIQQYRGSTSYHFYEAAETLGDLAMSRGDYPAASKYYGSIVTRATQWPEAQLRATLADGRALAAQKDYAGAKKRFTDVASSGLNSATAESIKMMAQVANAACDAESGQADAAIKALEAMVEKNDPKDSELFARMFVALGKSYEKANKPKDAILAFLKVDLLYFGEADAHPKRSPI